MQVVCIDMWVPYRDAARLVLPQAQVIVDKFHVVRMANEALDGVRKAIRADLTDAQRRTLMHDRFLLLKRRRDLEPREAFLLETWTGNFPRLAAAYAAKEAFYAVWEETARVPATARYDAWLASLTPELAEAFRPIITAVGNWREEIFAYFDQPVTNAYTEAFNRLIGDTNRLGRGYSFEVLRAKMLHAEPRKNARPRYDRDSWVA